MYMYMYYCLGVLISNTFSTLGQLLFYFIVTIFRSLLYLEAVTIFRVTSLFSHRLRG